MPSHMLRAVLFSLEAADKSNNEEKSVSSQQLFVVCIRVLGLWFLADTALSYWLGILMARFLKQQHNAYVDSISVNLIWAMSYTVVGLFFLIRAEAIVEFAEYKKPSPSQQKTEQSESPPQESYISRGQD